GVALGVAFADLLVVGLAADGARLDGLHRRYRHVEFARKLGVNGSIGFLDEVGARRAFNLGAVHAGVTAVIDVTDTDRIVETRDVGVVGEAVMLLLRIVEK